MARADVSVRGLLIGAVAWLALLVGAVGATALLLRHWHQPWQAPALTLAPLDGAGPALQTAPQLDRQQLQAAQQARLRQLQPLGATVSGAAPDQRLPPQMEIVQHLNIALPLDTPLTDGQGHALRLRQWFGDGRPVVLLLGYYRCPQLCNLTAHALIDALLATGLPPSAYRVVGISIDPSDTPATAAERQRSDRAYAAARADGRPLPELQLLVGPATATAALARALGFAYQPQEGPSRYAHAAGFAIATPDGRLSRYFFGLQFDPPALRQALVDAGDGRIGSLAERLLLLCAHFDPRNGRHSATVMGVARAVGGAAIAGTVLLVLWQRRRPRADAGAAR